MARKSAAHLTSILDALAAQHGEPARPVPRAPLEWILWENVAYLVDDARRERAYRALASQVGLTAEKIAAASTKVLGGIAALGGMHADARVDRLKECAEIALEHGGGDLRQVLDLALPEARKVLKRFPGIGDPGAGKILMHCGASAGLSLESNGLRVAVRLGYGEEKPSYASTYRSCIAALEHELRPSPGSLARAHLLLRAHGRAVCKAKSPDCDVCPLTARCRFFAALS